MGFSLRNLGKSLVDIFSADTEDDQRRRLASGQQRFYADQQRALGNNRPATNVGSAFLGNTARLVNTTKAGVGGAYGLNRLAIESLLGTDESYKNMLRGVTTTLKQDLSPNSGLFGAGTGFDNYEQAKNIGPLELTKRIGAGGFGTAGEILPTGKGLSVAQQGLRVVPRIAAEGAVMGAIGSAGDQYVRTGKINPKELALSTVAGGLLAAAPPVAGAGLKAGGKAVVNAIDNATPLNQVGAVGKNVNTPQVVTPKPEATAKNATASSIDPDDPFGNRNVISKVRGELGSLVDDDAQMIVMLRKIEKETGRKGLVDQWYFDTGNVKASRSMANAKLKNSDDLAEAFGGLSKKEIAEYDDYAAARAEFRNYDGKQTSQSKADLEARMSAGDAKYGTRYEAQNRYYKQMAQDMYDGGLISKDKLDEYLGADDYIRIQRDMEDLVGQGSGSSQARSIGSTTATQKRTGSSRDILSPSMTTAKRTQDIQLEINRNKAASNTIDTLEELGIAKRVDDSKNRNTISRLVDGERQVFEVPADIKKVMDNVNPYQLGILAKIVSAPVRLLRAGATALSAPFTITNYLRDQASSAIYSKNVIATHDPRNIFQGLGSAVKDTLGESRHPLWKKFEQFYGDQTIFDDLRNVKSTKRVMREIRRGNTGKYGNMATSPIRTLEDLNSITEKATRFQNFKGIYEKVLKETGDENEAIKAAVLAARQNSVDFQRNSAFTRTANLFIPYFNAGVQGSRNVARSFKNRPVATSMKSVGFVVLPSVALTMYNYADEDRRKVYESIDDFEKEDNFILVGPNPKQKADGTWEGVYKIPKPQGYRELTDPARELTEAFVSGEPVEDVAGMFKDMIGGLTGPISTENKEQFVGGLIPQQVKPSVQAVANRDFYTGNKIVPDYMTEGTDDPSKQAYKDTSGTARWIADQLGVSPIKVEKFFSDAAGSIGRYTLNASDNALANAGKIPEEQIGGRSIKEDFSRRLFEASGDLLEENKTAGRKFYEKREAFTNTLSPQEKTLFAKVNPDKKNFLGETIFESNKLTKVSDYGDMIANPEFTKKYKAYQQSHDKHDPLWDLNDNQLRSYMQAQVISKNNPGGDSKTVSALYDRLPKDFFSKREKFFADLKSKGVDMAKSDYTPRPKMPDAMASWSDWYHTLPYGTGQRSEALRSKEGQAYIAWLEKNRMYNNQERADLGLPPLEDSSQQYGYGSSGGGKKKTSVGSPYKYAVNATGSISKPTVRKGVPKTAKVARRTISTPKVTLKKSQV